jgi:hypothetical protein
MASDIIKGQNQIIPDCGASSAQVYQGLAIWSTTLKDTFDFLAVDTKLV